MPSPIPATAEPIAQTSDRNRLRTDTLAASVALLLAATLVQRSVGFGRGILFCRWLTPESLGQWEMAYSFLLLAAPLAVLGVPGSFGRYAEHYRQRGHLRTFLERAALWTAICGLFAVTAVFSFAPTVSTLLFGSDGYCLLVYGIALALAAVVFHHTLTALLVSLRMYRVVSAMNLAQSLLFATAALSALLWRPGVAAIVFGYGVSSLLAGMGALAWSWPGLRTLDRAGEPLPHSDFWPKLLRFAFFVWLTNLLSHLFAIVDRYMIVHFSGMSPEMALQQVGNYHSSRIVPLLFVSFADLLAGLVMPHWTDDWEAGRREAVGRRVNAALKATGLGMAGVGLLVLVGSPFLFGVVLQGRYDQGLAVLPWTLAACVWGGLFCLAQNYLWCAEKTRLATVPLALGLAVNVALNFALLPVWGLLGAVVATAVSSGVCLAATLELSRRMGMQIEGGTWLIAALPVALGLGAWTSATVLCVVVLASLATELVFSRGERRELLDNLAAAASRHIPGLRGLAKPSTPAGGTS